MLLHEIRRSVLAEEESSTVPASKFWEDNKSSAKTYVVRRVFYVKANESGKYDVFFVQPNNQKQKLDSLSKADLDVGYAKSSPDQQPDAEGYQTYRSNKKVTGIQNKEDDVILVINGKPVPFVKGDYLIKSIIGTAFAYKVLNEVKFKSEFRPN